MARKIEVIKSQIIAQKDADSTLSGLNSPSQTAIYNLWAYITAVAIGILEQLLDVFRRDMEVLVSKSAPSTYVWIREKVKLFQFGYDVKLNTTDLTYYYETTDTTAQIISRVSVLKGGNKTVFIKVAKSEPPVALNGTEKTAVANYVNEVCSAGIDYQVISLESDKLYIRSEIFYNGQFSDTIENDVKTAIADYLSNISSPENFNGTIKISAIQDVIQSVTGVTDVLIKEVKLRDNNTVFASASRLVGGATLDFDTRIIYKSSETVSGYVVTETTPSYTIDDSLTFTAV